MGVEMDIEIRKIEAGDNEKLAVIIRQTLREFKADKPGTVYYDDSTDHLSDLFQIEQSVYYVLLHDGALVGGAGIYPTEGLPNNTVELVKMYLLPEARGLGFGKMLISKCMETAVEYGFSHMYLETMAELKAAVHTYVRLGFHQLSAPLGNSGHHSCEIWMLKELK